MLKTIREAHNARWKELKADKTNTKEDVVKWAKIMKEVTKSSNPEIRHAIDHSIFSNGDSKGASGLCSTGFNRYGTLNHRIVISNDLVKSWQTDAQLARHLKGRTDLSKNAKDAYRQESKEFGNRVAQVTMHEIGHANFSRTCATRPDYFNKVDKVETVVKKFGTNKAERVIGEYGITKGGEAYAEAFKLKNIRSPILPSVDYHNPKNYSKLNTSEKAFVDEILEIGGGVV